MDIQNVKVTLGRVRAEPGSSGRAARAVPAAAPALPPARCPACGGAFREVEPTAATGGTDAGSRPAGAEHHSYEARIDAWLGGTATTRVGLVRFALADEDADEDGLIHAARELASDPRTREHEPGCDLRALCRARRTGRLTDASRSGGVTGFWRTNATPPGA